MYMKTQVSHSYISSISQWKEENVFHLALETQSFSNHLAESASNNMTLIIQKKEPTS